MWRGVPRGGVRQLCGIAAAALLIVAAGCGDDTDGDDAQPAPDVSTFQNGTFDDLPRFPRSDEFGRRSTEGEIVTQSFRARGASVERILDFYETALEEQGWIRSEPVHREPGAGRADWVQGDHRLELSAIDVTDRVDDAADESVVQYSVVLRPA